MHDNPNALLARIAGPGTSRGDGQGRPDRRRTPPALLATPLPAWHLLVYFCAVWQRLPIAGRCGGQIQEFAKKSESITMESNIELVS
jgi:hypothetical protein